MKTIQEMLQELSQCIVTVSGEFRFRTNWSGGGKVPQPDLDTFDPNVPFCIENVGDVPVEIGLYNETEDVRDQCVYSYDLETWQNYKLSYSESLSKPIVLSNNGDRVYIKASFHDVAPKFGATHFCVLNESANTKIRARGNIASLTDGSNDDYKTNYLTAPKYCYYEMFKDCTSLVQGPDLPATNLETKTYFGMFGGCTSLVQAPNLPAEVLTESCYDGMFGGCTSLVTPPTISAKTLAKFCCRDMFSDCTSLTQAPELPATTLAEYCYDDMFARCTSLTQAPELPAMTLAPACYYGMFARCTSLTQAPELPATKLANICCLQMFCYCTSLTQAPELPATTLADSCYKQMFEGCTDLTQAPALPAKWLHEYCYQWMFDGCTKLNYVKCLATNGFTSTGCTTGWLRDVSATGTFECDNKKYFTIDSPNGIPMGWSITEINPAQPEPEKPDLDTFDPNVPFCIENVGDVPVEIGMYDVTSNINKPNRGNCKTSYDLKTWQDYTIAQTTSSSTIPEVTKITLANKGDRVYIKADIIKNLYSSDYTRFTVLNQSNDTKIRARGNIASINKGTDDIYKTDYLTLNTTAYDCWGCYQSMFYGCTSLAQAPELPATTLTLYCYQSMFYGCTSLAQAPELPATTLTANCYNGMFVSCKSLTQAPKLPAMTLAERCYESMFYNCIGLTQAPELPATTLGKYCYHKMFSYCASLVKAPVLPATTLAAGCYNSMLEYCKNLTQAPELPATILIDYCYDSMFSGCTSLTQAPELPATILADWCYQSMFSGCTSLTQAPDLPVTTLTKSCYSYMFIDCTSLIQAPELPATALMETCYKQMFYRCSSLNYVKCLATNISAYDCTQNWLQNVSSTGDFYTPASTNWTTGANGIPSGWTRHDIT